MQYDESLAFWTIILYDYSYREIRENSILLYRNRPLVRTDEDDHCADGS